MMFMDINTSAHFAGIAFVPAGGFALSDVHLEISLLPISAGHLLISP